MSDKLGEVLASIESLTQEVRGVRHDIATLEEAGKNRTLEFRRELALLRREIAVKFNNQDIDIQAGKKKPQGIAGSLLASTAD